MQTRKQQLINGFARKYGLEIDYIEKDKAVLTPECGQTTGSMYVKCYLRREPYWRAKVSVTKSDGTIHNATGPAQEEYFDDLSTITRWMQDGQLHRNDGPAIIKRDGRGNIISAEATVSTIGGNE
jgi:hypothetical protein